MPIAKQPNKWNTAVTCRLPMPRMIPEPAACRPSNSWNAPAIGKTDAATRTRFGTCE
jgi:hypothetical protein